VYDKPLFAGSSASAIYRPKPSDDEAYGGAGGEDLDKVLKTARFKPDKGFSGADGTAAAAAGPRSAPVQFEKEAEGDDPFGLAQFFDDAKRGTETRRPGAALDAIGKRGHMHAQGGGTSASGEAGAADARKRGRIEFE
jgi:SNW domain-containing protein 1